MKKKVLAVAVSIAVYLALFAAAVELMFRFGARNALFLGFPLLAVLYFLIAGAYFDFRIGLRRRVLWLWMNLAGYPLCWAVLTLLHPTLWFNFGIGLVMLPVTLVFLALWTVVRTGFLVRHLFRRYR